MNPISIKDLEEELTRFFNIKENILPEREFVIQTGHSGQKIIDKYLQVEAWLFNVKDVYSEEQVDNLRELLLSNDNDKVAMTKVLLKLKQNELNF